MYALFLLSVLSRVIARASSDTRLDGEKRCIKASTRWVHVCSARGEKPFSISNTDGLEAHKGAGMS